MSYVLVVLRASGNAGDEQHQATAHERFIDSLIRRNLVLLGGGFAAPSYDARAAYLLRCDGVEEARRITSEDPFVAHDVMRPEFLEWELVGINPDAIEHEMIVRPSDVP
jgi:hypothetical protein